MKISSHPRPNTSLAVEHTTPQQATQLVALVAPIFPYQVMTVEPVPAEWLHALEQLGCVGCGIQEATATMPHPTQPGERIPVWTFPAYREPRTTPEQQAERVRCTHCTFLYYLDAEGVGPLSTRNADKNGKAKRASHLATFQKNQATHLPVLKQKEH